MAGWLETASHALDLPPLSQPEIDALLDLTRDVAHGTERRYAPLTSFLAGLAVGASDRARAQAVDDVVARLRAALPESG